MVVQRCTACLLRVSTRTRPSASRFAQAAANKQAAFYSTPSGTSNTSTADAGPSSIPASNASTAKVSSLASSSQTSPSPSPRQPPPLPRPLGLPQPPSKHVKLSIKERAERMMNKDAKLAERKHIIKEVGKGYFGDYNKLRHEGGKIWIAPKTLIQEKAALYFPEMEGRSIGTDKTVYTSNLLKGKISLVAMLSTRISEAHVESYTSKVLEGFKGDPNFQFVQINCQENSLKWILVGIFISGLKRSVPAEYRDNYLLSTENLEYLREPMGMDNKHIGYVYLVDQNCKIRWAAVSLAQTLSQGTNTEEVKNTVDEVEALRSCISVLLSRLHDNE